MSIEITKNSFLDYRGVQMSGVYNMITEAECAADEAGMCLDLYFAIIDNYALCVSFFIDTKLPAESINVKGSK